MHVYELYIGQLGSGGFFFLVHWGIGFWVFLLLPCAFFLFGLLCLLVMDHGFIHYWVYWRFLFGNFYGLISGGWDDWHAFMGWDLFCFTCVLCFM